MMNLLLKVRDSRRIAMINRIMTSKTNEGIVVISLFKFSVKEKTNLVKCISLSIVPTSCTLFT
jgi:hypothetical protein